MLYCCSVVQKTWLCTQRHTQQPNVLRFCVSSLFSYVYGIGGGLLSHACSRGRTFDEILTSDVEQWLLVVGWICCLSCLLNDMYVALDCLGWFWVHA